jgi:hypothetical protein
MFDPMAGLVGFVVDEAAVGQVLLPSASVFTYKIFL